MDSTEFNKIAGAGLLALLIFLLLNFFSGAIYGTRGAGEHDGEEQVLAYALAVEEAGDGEAAEEEQIDYAALVASADPSAGESAFRACTACHKLEEGANAVGPHLFDVVGRAIASVEGFNYSDALLAAEGDWTLEHLAGFLENPKGWAPGTKMAFAGIRDPQDRVNVIAYLNEVGGTPVDLAAGLEPVAAAGDATGEAAGETAGETATDATEPEPMPDEQTQDQNVGGEVTGRTVVDAEEEDAPTGPAAETHEAEPEGEDAVAVTDPSPAAPVQEQPSRAGAPGEGVDPMAGAPDAAGAEEDAATAGEAPPDERVEGEDAPPQSPPGEPRQTDPQQQLQPGGGEAAASGEQAAEEGAQAPAAGQPAEGEGEGEQLAAAPATEGEDAGGASFAGGDAAEGEKIFRRCVACHKVEEGQHGVGPSLWGVVGRDIAAVDDYNYSDAMAAHEGAWTPETLSAYLENPKAVVPGTKMAFPGLRDEQDRIDVITYLNEQSDSPIALE